MHPFLQTPKDWAVARLADLVVKVGSGATPRGGNSAYLPSRERYALVRSQNVLDRRLDTDGVTYISNNDAARLANAEVRDNDVLLNITGDGVTFARSCLADPSVFPCVVNQHVSIIRTVPELLAPGFLLGYLSLGDTKRYIESFNAGGSRRAITKGNIESFLIPLPPIEEQRRIAAVLGALDDKIELNRKMNRTLEELAQTLFKSWFIDFDNHEDLVDSELGTIPRGWTIAPLADCTSYLRRGISPSYSEENGTLVLNQKCIRDFRVSTAPARLHNPAKRPVEDRLLVPGDILINSTGVGTLGRIAQLPDFGVPLVCDSHVTVVRAEAEVNSTFLGAYLKHLQPTIEGLGQGSTGQTELTRDALARMALRIPPKALQSRFSDVVDPLLSRMFCNEQECETLTQLRDLLLPKLISGEIRVPESLTLPTP